MAAQRSYKVSTRRGSNTGTQELKTIGNDQHGELSTTQQFSSIQDSLATINKKLSKLDSLEQIVSDIKADLWGDDGIDCKVREIAEVTEYNDADIKSLKEDNRSLRTEIALLKSIVIKMDRKIETQGRQITDLKSRSMRENVMIYNFEENINEKLEVAVPKAIKEYLGVDVEFIRIHRNGRKMEGKTRTITGKLIGSDAKKIEILSAQKEVRKTGRRIPFTISPQFPPEVAEERRKLHDVSVKYRENSIKTNFVGNRLVLEDGSVHKDKVSTPRVEDVLLIDNSEKEKLDEIKVFTTKSVIESKNKFKGNGKIVKNINEVRELYKKIATSAECAKADHNILVFKFGEEEGYCDDNEHGAGRRLLRMLKEKKANNVAIVISRWYSGIQLGPRRFAIIEDVANEVLRGL